MAARWLEIFCNDDGRFSRTQTQIILCFVFSICVITAHIVKGGILTTPVLLALLGLHLFSFAERADIRHLRLQLGKDGAQLSMGGDQR